MHISNSELADIFLDLRETNNDLRKTYEAAAENVYDQTLRNQFNTLADVSRLFAAELDAEVNKLGQSPDLDGSFVGILHRGFMEIRDAFGQNDVDAVIDECTRAAMMALDTYEDALSRDLPAASEEIISRQYRELKAVSVEVPLLKRL